jgi:hypothetical protein
MTIREESCLRKSVTSFSSTINLLTKEVLHIEVENRKDLNENTL